MATRTRQVPAEVVDLVPDDGGVGAVEAVVDTAGGRRQRIVLRLPNLRAQLTAVERLLKRDEADVVLVAGNALLVALELIEWPVAALTLGVHVLARSRFKGLEAIAEVVEEVE
jgi:hypothetical protein